MRWAILLLTMNVACATAADASSPDAGATSDGGDDVAPGADGGAAPPQDPDESPDEEPALEVAYISGYLTDGIGGMSDVGSLVLVGRANAEPLSADVRVLGVTDSDPVADVYFALASNGPVPVVPGVATGTLNPFSAALLLGSGLVPETHEHFMLSSIIDVDIIVPGNYDIHATATVQIGDTIVDLPFVIHVQTVVSGQVQVAATRIPVQ